MADYRVDAMTKEEWALRAWSAEARLAEAQDRTTEFEAAWRKAEAKLSEISCGARLK